jgi:uncharacterized protein YecE (DUF72 family)
MIRVGIGGWNFAPWKGLFYPKGLKAAEELSFASRKVTAIEVNGTFYRAQTPASFARWHDETPDGFMFTIKGHRAISWKKDLRDNRESMGWFLDSGVAELKEKLGPLVWQLAPFKRFEPEEIGGFMALLPKESKGVQLRHALEVRHKSFVDPDFIDLARRHGVAIVFADSDDHPPIADPTADFIYARLERMQESEPTGYAPDMLDRWRARARLWEEGKAPKDLPIVGKGGREALASRDVFIFMINGFKPHAPAAAMSLLERLAR